MEYNWIMQTATILLLGIIAFFLKDTLAEIKKNIAENATRQENFENKTLGEINNLRCEFNNLKSDLPFVYVTREDFVRSLNSIDSKLDKIYYGSKGGKADG